MKPPRYLLREFALLQILRGMSNSGKFLEVGYGAGDLLITMGKLGFYGDGFDISNEAKGIAQKKLNNAGMGSQIKLINHIPSDGKYTYILLMEVCGYWQDFEKELIEFSKKITPGGTIIFSFTNSKHAGYAEEITGSYKTFSKDEMILILESNLKFKVEKIINYGYPLSNMLRPFLHVYHRIRGSRKAKLEQVQESGLAIRHTFIGLASVLFNKYVIYPFCLLQDLFKESDLGNGFIVVLRF